MNTNPSASEGNAPRFSITFESPSGQTLSKRFAVLKRHYARLANDNPADWIAAEFKKSLINNIEKGTIVVTINDKQIGLA